MRLFRKKVEGQIGYFGLSDWWLSTFTKKERKYIDETFTPMGFSSHSLTKGKIDSSSGTASGLLSGLATWFKKPEDYQIACRILSKSLELAKDSFEADSTYSAMIQIHYRMRDLEPGAMEAAIDACRRQIAIAPKVIRRRKKENDLYNWGLYHKGYTQLAIILEKQKKYPEAIQLAKKAKAQGWDEDWDKRIARCQKKLNKQKKS